ncbi:DNA-binding Lrp family transcriptional regulator [Azospirillum agricola]|uniref:Lrp/AsnC family transcriptional regulator n=1 Tax=Azospirillum agricola TaxID=1720247 RepID=UPI001F35D989|nr:AsnC family transcriptional regulator [Azospirillum agricola]MBP2230480.1 DNA-binding Lrp family transcriptional regulator [Azospirillum agricola]
MELDGIDRALINRLQDGLPLTPRPFADVAAELGLDEGTVIDRVAALRRSGVLSRFGPLYNAERMGGGLSLAAMAVPAERFEEVAALVNGFPEVAHNYAREHTLSMWFVLATETPERLFAVAEAIEARTGLAVRLFPKLAEYALDLRFTA